MTYHTTDSADSSEDEIRRRRGAVKAITLSHIPNATGLRRWQQEMYIQVCVASKGSQQRTMAWLKEIEIKSLSDLEAPRRRWDDLDAALAAVVVNVARGPLQREIVLYQERRLLQGQLDGTRRLVACVSAVLDRGQAIRVDMNAVFKLEYKGDLEAFLRKWSTGRIRTRCWRWYRTSCGNAPPGRRV